MSDFDQNEDLEAKKRALAQFNPSAVMHGISQIESSGGQFRDHAMNNSGVQAGTKSVSSYGLMPNTVYEFAKRNKQFQQTPQGQAVLNTGGDPGQINTITQDVKSDDNIMQNLLQDQDNRLKPYYQNTNVDPNLANVLAHRRGVSGTIKAIQNNTYQNDPYVQKYLQLIQQLNKPQS